MQIVDQFELGQFVEIQTINDSYYRGEILGKGKDHTKIWGGWVEILDDDPPCHHLENVIINVEHIVSYMLTNIGDHEGEN